MLDTLHQIADHGGPLVGVRCAHFQGDPRFVTAIELRFEFLTVVFRAMPEDDTLAVRFETLVPESNEELVELESSAPWSEAIGLGVCWAWQLTNQQGYADGIRLEFNEAGLASRLVIEFVVIASSMQVFSFAATPAQAQFARS